LASLNGAPGRTLVIQFPKEKLCLILVLQDISASLEGDAIVNYDVVYAHAAKTFNE
jgi:hypothetical protein